MGPKLKLASSATIFPLFNENVPKSVRILPVSCHIPSNPLLYARWLFNRGIILVNHPSVDIPQRIVSKFSFIVCQ